ncbi:MAG: molybdopterin synthase sulfur carrier subunit [Gammaproteobacteria bacterium]|jgi:molybdopterin synthase sulfur carrier subunit|nr:molybdopterin synthase sulfur carrier subunit [Gammaproteobacteria bacterium]|tara:strand:+ start:1802 stop:2059 length:258 start_codon:yes stop_codon:yes gene_type:complete
MLTVILPESLATLYTSGEKKLTVEGKTLRNVVKNLNDRFPGLDKALNEEAISVAIDGEIYQDAFLEKLDNVQEICFLPRIGGGYI